MFLCINIKSYKKVLHKYNLIVYNYAVIKEEFNNT